MVGEGGQGMWHCTAHLANVLSVPLQLLNLLLVSAARRIMTRLGLGLGVRGLVTAALRSPSP
jgi:hypothetical protein